MSNGSGRDGVALPLSAAQREIWLAEQRMGAENAVYKVDEYMEIAGAVDPVLFESALRHVVAEVDSLHVRFVEDENGPSQVEAMRADWPMPLVDVTEEPNPAAAARRPPDRPRDRAQTGTRVEPRSCDSFRRGARAAGGGASRSARPPPPSSRAWRGSGETNPSPAS